MSEQPERAASSSEHPTSSLPPGRPFRGPMQRWPKVFDVVLTLLAVLITVAIWRHRGDADAGTISVAAAGVAALVGNGAIYWRRRLPVRVHWIVMSASCMALLSGRGAGVFAMAFSLYSLGRYSDNTRASLLGLFASLLFAGRGMLTGNLPGAGSIAALAMVMAVWYLGRRIRFRGEHMRLLEERATYLEAHRQVAAEKAVAEERARIARELHDIVAHQVSLMTVQAGAAKTVASEAPEAAIVAMGAVEEAGRQALGELRHLLGVLRPDREASILGPQPGFSDLSKLVEQLAEAGLKVALTVQCTAEELPARVELAGYRIVQEALTNVLKHAGPTASARVVIVGNQQAVDLLVEDNGAGVASLTSGGHGLAGMRERAQLLGGSLLAGARQNGGFRVEAHLPLSTNSAGEEVRFNAEGNWVEKTMRIL